MKEDHDGAEDNRVIYAQAIQIRRQAPTKAVPTMPGNSGTLEHVLHFPLITGIQVKRISD
jgi:hypothetical protein